MYINNLSDIYNAELSDKEFEKFGSMIYKLSGIKMPVSKKIMVQARLKKRLRALDMNSFSQYIEYVFSKKGFEVEIIHLLDVISTNKTDFFRESTHFSFLAESVLPQHVDTNGVSTFKVWSAGCSSGEEVYTLAMVFSEFALKQPNFDYSIFGSDLSTTILTMASNGVYSENKLKPSVSDSLVRKYFMKSKDPAQKTFRVVPELRQKTRFARVNFMDDSYLVPEKFDAIFCRNVLIYFDRNTQERVVQKLCNYLKPGGYFFHGHSESLIGMDLPLSNLKPTVFWKE